MKPKVSIILIAIFALGLILRFLYFPNNIYFGGEQARDAIEARNILNRQYPLLGPHSTLRGIHHSPLYYYVLAPLYYIGNGDPRIPAFFIRVIHACGVFVVFSITSLIFSWNVGLIAALLYAISVEQIQMSIYLSNASIGLMCVLLSWWGMLHFAVKKRQWGMIVAALFAGLAMLFDLIFILTGFTMLCVYILRRSKFPPLRFKTRMYAALAYSVSMLLLLYVNGLQSIKIIRLPTTANFFEDRFSKIYMVIRQWSTDNLIALPYLSTAFLIIVGIYLWHLTRRKHNLQFMILAFWLLVGIIPYFFTTHLWLDYYYHANATVVLLLVSASLLEKLMKTNSKIFWIILFCIVFINTRHSIHNNPDGPNNRIIAPGGLLLTHELDVIFEFSSGNPESREHYQYIRTSPEGEMLLFYLTTYYHALWEQ